MATVCNILISMKTEMANLHCECQELKPKAETNSLFLVLQPSSGVHTVNTVGSHLKKNNFALYVIKRETRVKDNFFIQLQGGFC